MLKNQLNPFSGQQWFPTLLHRDDIGSLPVRNGSEIRLPTELNGKITLDRIGEHVGLTRERVRQIRNDVFLKLRRELTAIGISQDVLGSA
jgi:hypothetical protein